MPQQSTNIALNLYYYRLHVGLTRKKLSRRIERVTGAHIKPAALKAYESGITIPTPERLYLIAQGLSQPVEVFHGKADATLLLDKATLRVIESFKTLIHPKHRDAVLHISEGLAKR